jgi:hypothetical protein
MLTLLHDMYTNTSWICSILTRWRVVHIYLYDLDGGVRSKCITSNDVNGIQEPPWTEMSY